MENTTPNTTVENGCSTHQCTTVCMCGWYIQVYCSYSYDMIEDFFPFWDIPPFIILSENTQSSFRLRASEISPFLEFHFKPLPNRRLWSPVLEEQGGKTQAGKWIQVMDFSGGQFMEVLPHEEEYTQSRTCSQQLYNMVQSNYCLMYWPPTQVRKLKPLRQQCSSSVVAKDAWISEGRQRSGGGPK